jgi:hypothetical protein
VKGDLVYHNRLKTRKNVFSGDRMEPFVIGLFGQPGQGKSLIIPRIISAFKSLFPGRAYKDLVYERTCNVNHWDGYNGQPITVLDDLGQNPKGQDLAEFQTLVSCSPYILPMASLEEKGCYFQSSIIIITSNFRYGEPFSSITAQLPDRVILDDVAFWRRIHLPLHVEKGKYYRLQEEPNWVRHEALISDPQNILVQGRKAQTIKYNQFSFFQGLPAFRQKYPSGNQWGEYVQSVWKPTPEEYDTLLKGMIERYKERETFHNNISKTWTQRVRTVYNDTRTQVGNDFYEKEINPLLSSSFGTSLLQESETSEFLLEFEAYPPLEPLPVRVEPIREPLKVRTITAGMGDTFCLKPLQRAMWKALGCEPQFCLTHGKSLENAIERIHSKSDKDDVWISGDYTAATDSFSIEASKAILKGILESIDHEPTKRWAMKEISPHILVYPKSSGLEPVLQRSGQLMGSFLSFPLLCLLNDCTIASLGVSPQKYLINGDDILIRANESVYPRWKSNVQDFGLSLSLGKNYVHKVYGTVNSQLVKAGTVLNSGKQKMLDRRVQVLGECLRDLEFQMEDSMPDEVHELFKVVNRKKLSKTVRSIHVPVSHGGLAFSWSDRGTDPRTNRTCFLVYLHDLFKKIEPEKGCVSIPYLSFDKLIDDDQKCLEETFLNPIELREDHEDFVTSNALAFTKRRVEKNQNLRSLMENLKLEELPSLSFLNSLQIPFSDEKTRKSLQHVIDQVFLSRFFRIDEVWNYSTYRTLILKKSMELPLNTSVSREYIVKLMDLDVKPDFLTKIPVHYKPRAFSAQEFEKLLPKKLVPKEFNLPDLGGEDFSLEVIESYNCILDNLEKADLRLGESRNSLPEFSHYGIILEENEESSVRSTDVESIEEDR